jgi:hypothetical protein
MLFSVHPISISNIICTPAGNVGVAFFGAHVVFFPDYFFGFSFPSANEGNEKGNLAKKGRN